VISLHGRLSNGAPDLRHGRGKAVQEPEVQVVFDISLIRSFENLPSSTQNFQDVTSEDRGCHHPYFINYSIIYFFR
jgi:hypothetical protein